MWLSVDKDKFSVCTFKRKYSKQGVQRKITFIKRLHSNLLYRDKGTVINMTFNKFHFEELLKPQ